MKNRWASTPTQWSLALLLPLPLLLLAAALAWGWQSAGRAHAAAGAALQARQVSTALAALRGDALEADTDAARSLAGGTARLAQLRDLLAAEPAAYSQLVTLGPLLARRAEVATAAATTTATAATANAAAMRRDAGEARRLQALFDATWQPLQQGALVREQATQHAADAAFTAAGRAAVLPGTLALLLLAAAAGLLRRWRLAALQAEQRATRAADAEAQAHGDLQHLLQADPAALCLLDAEGRIASANAGCTALWGRPADALTGRAFLELMPAEDQRKTQLTWDAAQRSPGAAVHWRSSALHADGSRRPVDWQAVSSDRGLACAGHDRSALQAAEQQAAAAATALYASQQAQAELSARAAAAERLSSAFIPALHAQLAPLVPVIANGAGILLQGLAGPLAPEQRREAARIAEHAAALQARLTTALELARLQAGSLQFDNGAFDVWEAVNAVARETAVAVDAKGLKFDLQLADDLGYARGDAARVAQALRALLATAVARTGSGSVALDAGLTPAGWLRLAVRSSGAVPANDQALFEPFADKSDSGPALARGLARRMGGDVVVAGGTGGGCEFVLTLPADTLHSASSPAQAA